jgi:hypothetical protein
MISIQHAALAIDIPDEWRDQSTLLFVAPPPPPTDYADSKPKVPGQAIAVRFVEAAGRSASDYLKEQHVVAVATDPNARLINEAEFRCGLGPGRIMEQELTLAGHRLCQFSACVIIGPIAVLATASCGAGAPAVERTKLVERLASLRAVA